MHQVVAEPFHLVGVLEEGEYRLRGDSQAAVHDELNPAVREAARSLRRLAEMLEHVIEGSVDRHAQGPVRASAQAGIELDLSEDQVVDVVAQNPRDFRELIGAVGVELFVEKGVHLGEGVVELLFGL